MNITRRPEGWEVRLEEFVESMRNVPFAWGTNDCVSFSALAVEKITGEKVLHDFPWGSAQEAENYIAEKGGLVRAIIGALGKPLSKPGLAQRGDVCLVRWEEEPDHTVEAVGICVGVHVVGPGPLSMRFVPRKFTVMAWAVGRE